VSAFVCAYCHATTNMMATGHVDSKTGAVLCTGTVSAEAELMMIRLLAAGRGDAEIANLLEEAGEEPPSKIRWVHQLVRNTLLARGIYTQQDAKVHLSSVAGSDWPRSRPSPLATGAA
jgi:hypothetical protein